MLPPTIIVQTTSRAGRSAIGASALVKPYAASVAVHLGLFAALAITPLGTTARYIQVYGSRATPTVQVTLSDSDVEVDAIRNVSVTMDVQMFVTPDRASVGARHFVREANVAPPPMAPAAVELPAPAPGDAQPRRDSTSASDTLPPTPSPPRHSASTARRRRSSAASPAVAPVDAPLPPIAFVGRPARYPELARQAGWEGTVVLIVQIQDDGRVIDVRIERSSGQRTADAEAVQAVRTWRAVSTRPGQPVHAMTVRLPVEFSLSGSWHSDETRLRPE